MCELVGADVDHVRRPIGPDRRIGPSFLLPGVGYGGNWVSTDVKVLIRFSADKDYEFRILRPVESVNAFQKTRLVTRMKGHFGSLKGKTVAVGGSRSNRTPTTCVRCQRSR